ncbi:Lrp/AsnC family transcriptional regulator [Streptomyces sp. NBC_00483]|uniref:Lrp/AsnC family transcriptional regulator n=1 Tax=Streptomyces sp. NBC_00483 TaxID=2975756 RepID=UPI002E173425
MPVSADLDETDLALLNALQVSPRAPWAAVGKALGTDAATATRRWRRLADEGLGWVTGYPSGALDQLAGALVEIDCDAARTQEVAAAIAQDPEAFTVEETAGGRDLLLTVSAPDLAALAGYISGRLRLLPGVRATRTSIFTDGFTDGAGWRLGALDAAAQRELGADTAHSAEPPSLRDELDRHIMMELSRDGRVSATELSKLLGVGITTAARRLRRLLATRTVQLRCEVSRAAVGLPVTVTLWAATSPQHLAAAGQALSRLPRTRLAVAVAGSSNVICVAWLPSLHELGHLEAEIAHRAPELTVMDRAVTLRPVKHSARLLDSQGRARSTVVADLWSRQTCLPTGADLRL